MTYDEALRFLQVTKENIEGSRAAQREAETVALAICQQMMFRVAEALEVLNKALRVVAPGWRLVFSKVLDLPSCQSNPTLEVSTTRGLHYRLDLERIVKDANPISVGEFGWNSKQVYFLDSNKVEHSIDPLHYSLDTVLRNGLSLVMAKVF